MTQTTVKEGWVRLSSPNGVKDTRNGYTCSEAVVRESDAQYFVDVE